MSFIRTRTCFSLIVLASVGLMLYIYGRYPRWEDEVPLFLVLVNAAVNISLLVVGVFRCRDLGWSGWRILALVVPVANLILVLILMFRSSAVASNPATKTPGH